MIIIPELKKIAVLNDKIKRLANIVENEYGLDELDIKNAYLITGCSVEKNHLYKNGCMLDNYGLVDDLYFCCQDTGYCEDDFYGTLYFKTNVPGQYVAVPFSM